MGSLEADLRARLLTQAERTGQLLGADILNQSALKLRVHDRARQYAVQLEDDGEEQLAVPTASGLRDLVDLDDPEDARSPLGIAVGLLATDDVSQVVAANLLGVTLQKLWRLTHTGLLRTVQVPDKSRPRITRASIAERLAAKNSRGHAETAGQRSASVVK